VIMLPRRFATDLVTDVQKSFDKKWSDATAM
jgi:hypothetical protein